MPISLRKNGTAPVLPARKSMNDQQLDRNLRSVVREIFVAYLTEFCDLSRSSEHVAVQIEEEKSYTESGLKRIKKFLHSESAATHLIAPS